MPRVKVDKYVNEKYDEWLGYSKAICLLSSSTLNHYEVLNHSLCMILEKDSDQVERMIDAHYLEFYVKRVIKTNIISPRSSFRYTKGQHCTSRIGAQEPFLSSEKDEFMEYINQHRHIVRQEFEKIEINCRYKEIFEWKFFNEKSYKDWLGPESNKHLYEIHNRIYSILFRKIWKLLAD